MIQKLLLVLFLGLQLIACSEQTFEFNDGQRRALNSVEGDWLLINYWAEWCVPCREEMPLLNEINAQEGFSVWGYNYDGVVGSELEILKEKLAVKFDQLANDPANTLSIDPPSALPATILIDPNGEFKRLIQGKVDIGSLRTLTGS